MASLSARFVATLPSVGFAVGVERRSVSLGCGKYSSHLKDNHVLAISGNTDTVLDHVCLDKVRALESCWL